MGRYTGAQPSSLVSVVSAAERAAKPLHEQLYDSSRRFAQIAMQNYLDGDMAMFFVHAGTALEQLAKTYLASLEPTLIADARSFDSLLHASGKGRHARSPRNRMKTITVSVALERCGQILPAIANLKNDLLPLLDARNGSIHVGDVDDAEKTRMLIPYLRASEQLLGEGGHDEKDYWGEYGDVVDARVAEQTEATAARVLEALTAARLRFDSKYGHLEEDIRRAVLQAITDGYAPEKYYQQFIECPACATECLDSGSIEVGWEPDYDVVDGEAVLTTSPNAVVTFYPGQLECRACELFLDGEEELDAAEVGFSWQLDDVNSEDFYHELVDEEDYDYGAYSS
jgi:hypothetical protein